MQVCVMHAGEVVHAQPLGAEPLHLGRASSNDLVLPRTDVSGHHAMIYRDADQVWLRDLGSSNGTFLNGERIVAPAVLGAGDVVRLGVATELRLSDTPDLPRPPLRLERVDGTVGWPVLRADFPIPGAGDVTLLIGDDELWLAVDGMETERIELGQPFVAGGDQYVLKEVTGPTPDTVRPAADVAPYEVSVSLDANEATLTDPMTGATCSIHTDHRVALLYALGQRWLADGPGTSRGWTPDEELALAIWGRQSRDQGANNLHVLVHRLRKEAQRAGFDRWLVEKRAGRTRLRVRAVRLSD
jgi:hypothetical protein